MDGEFGVVVFVESRCDEGELDSCDGTGASEEEMEFVVSSMGEGTEGVVSGGWDG